MEITLNGDKKITLSDNALLTAVFPDLEIEITTPGIAIAVNSKVISKSRWELYVLKDGDKVEVVRAFQGG